MAKHEESITHMKTSSADQMNKMQAQSEKEKSVAAKKTPMSGQHHMTMQHDSMADMNHQMGGMDMSDDHQMSGMHGHHMNMNMGDLNRRFWISLVLTVPVVLLSPMAGMKGLTFQFAWSPVILAVIGSILYFYGGKPFFSGAKTEFQTKKPGMMSLITLGITVAYFYSIYSVIANHLFHVTPPVDEFFWELSTLIDIMLLGHIIEMKSIDSAGSAVDALSKLLPATARVVKNGQVVSVNVADLKVNDIVQVQAGGKIPADGLIVKGTTTVNESLVTGESKLVSKTVNDEVIGGAINNDGTFEFKVTKAQGDSFLNKVMQLVQHASENKSHAQTVADQVAGYLFYAALSVAIIAFIVWVLVGGATVALPIAVTVLIIACPHALGLAVPLVVSRSTALAAQNGLLIRDSSALERANRVHYVLMDKTGTLTAGNFKLNFYQTLNDAYSKTDILKIAGSLEQTSSHPLAKGVMTAVVENHLQIQSAENVRQIPGFGLIGNVNGKIYQLVSSNFFKKNQVQYDQTVVNKLLADKNNSISFLIENNQVIGAIGEGDEIKPGSKPMIDYLKQHHIQPVMLTGDNAAIAESVARQLGISDFQAKLLPEDKQKIVSEYQQKGPTMFIGDGVNDAPSLSGADVGVAIGAGTDVAIDSADIVLVRSDPKDVVDLFKLAKRTSEKMKQNLWWGAGYNIIAIPLAAGILAFAGILLSPMVGAVLMSLSTVVVSINALTLRVG